MTAARSQSIPGMGAYCSSIEGARVVGVTAVVAPASGAVAVIPVTGPARALVVGAEVASRLGDDVVGAVDAGNDEGADLGGVKVHEDRLAVTGLGLGYGLVAAATQFRCSDPRGMFGGDGHGPWSILARPVTPGGSVTSGRAYSILGVPILNVDTGGLRGRVDRMYGKRAHPLTREQLS